MGGDDIYIAKYDSAGNNLWVNRCGGLHADYGLGAASDRQGNCITTGQFWGEAQFGSNQLHSRGGLDVFIAKFDSSGRLLWAINAGGEEYDRGLSVATDLQGNVFITGFFTATARFGGEDLVSLGLQDAFVAKYDSDGDLLWVRQMGGSHFDIGVGITVDRNGYCYVTGSFNRSAVFGETNLESNGQQDAFIVKFNPEGKVEWVRQGGGSGMDRGNDVAVDPQGNCYVTGSFEEASSFGDHTDSVYSIGMKDLFIAKYDVFGRVVWVCTGGGPNADEGYGIDVDHHGGCVFTGSYFSSVQMGEFLLYSSGGEDIFFGHVDHQGRPVWVKTAGGPSDDVGRGLFSDESGDHFAIWHTQNLPSGLYLIRMDADHHSATRKCILCR